MEKANTIKKLAELDLSQEPPDLERLAVQLARHVLVVEQAVQVDDALCVGRQHVLQALRRFHDTHARPRVGVHVDLFWGPVRCTIIWKYVDFDCRILEKVAEFAS